MSRIDAVDPQTALADVKPLLDAVQKGMGVLPNMFRVAARAPAALEALVALFGATGKGRLDARTREAVALAVSESNGCDYCLSAHTLLGKRAGLGEGALLEARLARSDDARLAALLELTRAIVDHRGRVAASALDQARSAGVTDSEIVELVANVALTTFTNYLNEVAGTEIDFPIVRHRAR
ncbi:MAG TPA: carboxymuconolactone decarboxylase family protein [Polyangiaceae bacterium]|jgi:uncharacterized peroxidase-related enzyme